MIARHRVLIIGAAAEVCGTFVFKARFGMFQLSGSVRSMTALSLKWSCCEDLKRSRKTVMYLRRLVFAVVLGLVWYCSGFGYFLVQVGCCALCFLPFFLSGDNSGVCESSTQTDCVADQATSQQEKETGHIVGRDEPDTAVSTVQKASQQSQYPNIQRSLQHLFKCAYTHLVLPWSITPELGDNQPLHTALLTEFNFVMDKIILKAKDVDLSVTALGCIQIFTQHLHKAKQSEGSPAFSSKAEEIALITEICKALIHNLVPKHLWEPNIYSCVLQEILSMKALALVTLLSDPNNLNHLIISQLDQMPSEVHDPDRDSPSSKWSENSDVLQGEAEEHPSEEGKYKKKGKRLKEKFYKLFGVIMPMKDKLKRKKKEVMEKDAPSRRAAKIPTDDTSSNEGSICDSCDTDVESLASFLQDEMEFKLSYEMWRVGTWAVTVTNVQMEGNELCFTVHLEDNPANLHWDVVKKQSDIIQFYNQCKEMGPLPSSLTIVEKTEWDEAKKEEAKKSLEQFLQGLVKNTELGNSKLVFQFLGPIDWILHEEENGEGLWALLGGIASFLNPGHDDEPSNLKLEDKQHEVIHECKTSEVTPKHEQEATRPMCTENLESQDKETKDESDVADERHLPMSEQTSTCTNDKQHVDHIAQFFDEPGFSVDLAEVLAQKKYLKFDHNFQRVSAALSSSNSNEDSLIHSTNDAVSISNDNGNISKKEDLHHRKSLETDKPERKEKDSHSAVATSSQPPEERKMSNSWEKLETSKVIFDLLKEICGNSYTFKFLKTVVTPFTPLINKKISAFLEKMNPSEAQIASYIDNLCKSIWPETPEPQPLPQSSDMNEIKQKARHIMTSKLSSFAVNKTNVESIFKIFQIAEENKKLVYMLLTYLLGEFLHSDPVFKCAVQSKLNVKPTI